VITVDDIIKIASYFKIIAHTPGRLRLRVNPKITKEASSITLNDIKNLPNKIKGIEAIKVNKVIASVTILYNPEIFSPNLWENLIKYENLDELKILINKLEKEII